MRVAILGWGSLIWDPARVGAVGGAPSLGVEPVLIF